MNLSWRPLLETEKQLRDQQVGHDPYSGFMQSTFWANFKTAEGFEVIDLALESNDQVIGFASLHRYIASEEPGFIVCPEGPVLPWDQPEIARASLRQLLAHVKELPGALGFRIGPHLPFPRPSILRNWTKAPADTTPVDTLILNLKESEDQLLAQAHPKCRYNLRVADRYGVEVTSTQDPTSVHEFYELLLETSDRTGFFVEPLGFFMNLFDTLFKANAAELFVARHEGQALAAIFVTYFGMRATYLYGGSRSVARHVMPVYPLHRAAMRSATVRGCTEYDMYGIDAYERRDHLYAGITRFKKQWGGQVVRRVGTLDHVFYDALADLIVSNFDAQIDL